MPNDESIGLTGRLISEFEEEAIPGRELRVPKQSPDRAIDGTSNHANCRLALAEMTEQLARAIADAALTEAELVEFLTDVVKAVRAERRSPAVDSGAPTSGANGRTDET